MNELEDEQLLEVWKSEDEFFLDISCFDNESVSDLLPREVAPGQLVRELVTVDAQLLDATVRKIIPSFANQRQLPDLLFIAEKAEHFEHSQIGQILELHGKKL